MASGLSLANKCQMLFGVAVVVLLAGALAVPWFRATTLVEDAQLEIARQLARTIDAAEIESEERSVDLIQITADVASVSEDDQVVAAFEFFTTNDDDNEFYQLADSSADARLFFARAIRTDGRLDGIVIVESTGAFGAGQMLTSRIFLVAAGIVAGLIAMLVFYFILTKLIFSPVNALRVTTELVEQGDLRARSKIRTGDDFEQLSRGLDRMLDELVSSQNRLTAMNQSLDLKVSELAEANIGLFESNKLKSEFLANISHELKTPLNSIIGFAELLDEMEQSRNLPGEKELRYLGNIVASGRSLLEMINELLQMAKIEAGRVEVALEPVSIVDLLEGLRAIMGPQAETKSITLQVRVPSGIPPVETDPGKLQQILYNFLSNAIRFSPDKGKILIAVHRVSRQDGDPGVRIGVTDEGPGIPYDMQDAIFEKFRQVDASHTREHSGTGLGLAICRDLAALLGATVSLVSEPGHGATFSVEVPLAWRNKDLQPLMEPTRFSGP